MNIPNDKYDDKELLEFLGQQESQDINWGDHYAGELAERLETGKLLTGAILPWGKTHNLIRFREGEVTIWAGMNGHKKSMLLGQVMMWFALSQRVGVMSFEMPVIDTMQRLVYQAAGCVPSIDFGKQWSEWNHERICYYDQLDTVPAERVLGVIFYMANYLGCKHIKVDSLTKCGLPSGDRDAEKRFIDTLSATAKALNIHIHLVAHVRKPHQGGEAYQPTKFDIRGAGELTDLVDNVIIVWKDKKLEGIKQKEQRGGILTPDEKTYFDENPDQRLICAKQRRGEWEGNIGLWFHTPSLQFTPDATNRAMPFNFHGDIS
jgi:twinkle protein